MNIDEIQRFLTENRGESHQDSKQPLSPPVYGETKGGMKKRLSILSQYRFLQPPACGEVKGRDRVAYPLNGDGVIPPPACERFSIFD